MQQGGQVTPALNRELAANPMAPAIAQPGSVRRTRYGGKTHARQDKQPSCPFRTRALVCSAAQALHGTGSLLLAGSVRGFIQGGSAAAGRWPTYNDVEPQ